MSKVEELLAKYNPNGVQSRFLIDCSSVDYGFPFKSSLFTDDNTYIPIIRIRDIKNGKASTFYKGDYYNEYIVHRGDILVGMDGEFNLEKWNDIDSLLNQRVARINEKPSISLRGYLYHILGPVFKNIENETPSGSVKHLSVKIINSIQIPLPHIKVQEEIVKILDSFTNLIDALNEELSLRQKQFEYYREKLLTFDDNTPSIVKTSLGEIGDVCMCKRIMSNETNNIKGIPFYKIGTFGGVADSYISEKQFNEYKNKYKYPKIGDILLSASGTIGKTVVFDGKPSYFQDSNIVWIDNDETMVINSFLRYIYTVIDWKVDDGGVIKRLYNTNIRSTLIAFPKDKAIQQSIVSKLDAFESLISSLKEEIALRQKQYEYYREKLLTFE